MRMRRAMAPWGELTKKWSQAIPKTRMTKQKKKTKELLTKMESLFNTTLIVDGKTVDYTVFFRNDAYHFVSPEGLAEEIILKKEHDEWHSAGAGNEILVQTAAAALDRYLFSQH